MYNFISVVIPTYNNKYLRRCIECLTQQAYPGNMYEIIVVENPLKTDEVYNICKLNNCRHFVSELGSNRARNLGILRAKGQYIALCDDDILVDRHWLAAYNNRINENPNHALYGGSVGITSEVERPRWLYGEFLQYLSHVDYGFQVIPFGLSDGMHVVSANCCFAKEKWSAVGGLDESIGYHGDNMIPNDEVVFFKNLGYTVDNTDPYLYDGAITAMHMIAPERTTLEWLKNRFRAQGVADAQMMFAVSGNVQDVYHSVSYDDKKMRLIDLPTTMDTRNVIRNEFYTREYIKNIIICKTEYMIGFSEELEKLALI